MKDVNTFIESGILELYVLDQASAAEIATVQKMAIDHPPVALEIKAITIALEKYAKIHGVAPAITLKLFVLSAVDFIERIKHGEPLSFPPILHKTSQISDYAEWLNRKDMSLPDDFTDFHASIIAQNKQAITAIIWVKNISPWEMHTDELENFLIVEGACTIMIESDEYKLVPGDLLSIPLHKKHFLKVTSPFACKAILQRVAV